MNNISKLNNIFSHIEKNVNFHHFHVNLSFGLPIKIIEKLYKNNRFFFVKNNTKISRKDKNLFLF